MSIGRVIESPDLMIGFRSAGSACCVWRDGAGEYVATASHVLTAMTATDRMRWISNDLLSGSGTPLIDETWLPVPGGRLDAGLIRIDDPGPFRPDGPYPSGTGILPLTAMTSSLVVEICGKHGRTTARFDGHVDAGFTFRGHRHGRLLRFSFLAGETDPGDSGAAVLSMPDQMVVGMHIAREGSHSFAVPAADIREAFGALRFGFNLRP